MNSLVANKVCLQSRDYLLFEMICKFGYLTVDHVSKGIFFTSIKNTRRRLLQLEQAGFLKFITRRHRSGTLKVYVPNFSNLEWILEKEFFKRHSKVALVKPWFRSISGHEDIVRDWAIRLQTIFPKAQIDLDFMLADSKYKSSNKNRNLDLLPDIVLRSESGVEISIEIELTRKSQQRYFSKLTDIVSIPNRSTIYLVPDQKLKSVVQNILVLVLENIKRKNQLERSSVQVLTFDDLNSDEKIIEIMKGTPGRRPGCGVQVCAQPRKREEEIVLSN
jgi:hypothetical protein